MEGAGQPIKPFFGDQACSEAIALNTSELHFTRLADATKRALLHQAQGYCQPSARVWMAEIQPAMNTPAENRAMKALREG
jgi:hypothetical protein